MARRSPDVGVSSNLFLPARRRGLVLASLALIVTLAAALPALADQGVVLRDIAYQPADVAITVGDTVTWEHRDGNTPHTVTSTSGPESFDSNTTCTAPNPVTCMTEGDTFEHTFDQAGTYEYHCKIHAQMTGTVVVEAGDDTTTSSSTTTTTTAVSTTTAAPATTAPPNPAPAIDDQPSTTTAEPIDDEAAGADDETDGGGGAGGLAVILLTLMGVAAFLVWRFRPKPAIVVEDD